MLELEESSSEEYWSVAMGGVGRNVVGATWDGHTLEWRYGLGAMLLRVYPSESVVEMEERARGKCPSAGE